MLFFNSNPFSPGIIMVRQNFFIAFGSEVLGFFFCVPQLWKNDKYIWKFYIFRSFIIFVPRRSTGRARWEFLISNAWMGQEKWWISEGAAVTRNKYENYNHIFYFYCTLLQTYKYMKLKLNFLMLNSNTQSKINILVTVFFLCNSLLFYLGPEKCDIFLLGAILILFKLIMSKYFTNRVCPKHILAQFFCIFKMPELFIEYSSWLVFNLVY